MTSVARFDRHLRESDIPLLVDFWATWCGPCHAMAPQFEKAAAQLEPELRLVKVDMDASPELARRFSINSVPTLLLAHRGREIARRAGVTPLSELIRWTRHHVAAVTA